MSNTQIFILIALLIIFLISSFQIFLSVKIIRLLKDQKITHQKSETKQVMKAKIKKSVVARGQPHKNEHVKDEFQDEMIITVLLKMFTIRNAVHKQISNIHAKSIENAPKKVGIDEQLLLQTFTKPKLKLINDYWELFNHYVNGYWLNKSNNFKTVFSGDINKKTGEVGKMLVASEQLLLQLDKIIEQFQNQL